MFARLIPNGLESTLAIRLAKQIQKRKVYELPIWQVQQCDSRAVQLPAKIESSRLNFAEENAEFLRGKIYVA
jgi:hypothetical protein